MPISLILTVLLILFVLTMLAKTVRVIPQGRAGIVERLGKFRAVLKPGLHIVIPVVDRVLPLIDLREQVVSVVYFQVTDPQAATYEITNYIRAVDELTSATLRNVVGGLNLEQTLTSRDQINAELRGVLDSTTGRWGLRVSRVDIKEIQPPVSIQDSMEKQMRAERDRRAAILTAEGQKQSDILTAEGESRAAILRAEGEKQAQILRAEGDAQSAILRANGEAEAVQKVFAAIHEANPSQQLLTYQYLQTLPKLAEGDANKLWFIPTELGDALRGLGNAFGTLPASDLADAPKKPAAAAPKSAPQAPGSYGINS